MAEHKLTSSRLALASRINKESKSIYRVTSAQKKPRYSSAVFETVCANAPAYLRIISFTVRPAGIIGSTCSVYGTTTSRTNGPS